MSDEIKAEIEQLEAYRQFLQRNMDHNALIFEDFLHATSGVEWDDAVLENVVRVLNDIVKHLNNIRSEIAFANQALKRMIDILDQYTRIRVNK